MQSRGQLSWRLGTIIGMAAVWPSLLNQLLYPVSLLYNRTHNEAAYEFHIIYSVLLVALTLVFTLTHLRSNHPLTGAHRIIAVLGILGAIGVVLVGWLDFSTWVSKIGIGIGVGLIALFVSTHFLFWFDVMALDREGATCDMALSITLFALIAGIRLLLGIHSFEVTIACPLISAGCALYMRKARPTSPTASAFNLHQLPYQFLIPCFIFVIFCNVGILLFNTDTRLQTQPPYRTEMHFVIALFFFIAAWVYHTRVFPGERRPIALFSLVSLIVIGATILAVSFSMEQLNGGSVAFIAASSCLLGCMAMFIVSAAAKTHTSPMRPAGLFLALVIVIPRFIRACIMYQNTLLPSIQEAPDLFLITSIAAILCVVVVFVVILQFFWRTQPRAIETTAAPSNATTHALEALQHSFDLSDREMEIVQLAYRNQSAKKMSETLFIAESTVYTHLKRIYRKTDVHSKQELIDLIDNLR